MNVSSKRAEHVALTALILSVVFFLAAWLVGAMSGSFAVWAFSWQIVGGGIIWLILVILFHQRSLAEQEKLDMAQLTKAEKTGTIFHEGQDRTALFAVAQKRLAILEKWFMPAFSGLTAVYHITVGFLLYQKAVKLPEETIRNPLLVAVFMITIAFVSFLICRYATGMSAQTQWKPLRAGGNVFVATAILAFLLAVALAFVQFKAMVGIRLLVWVVPALMVIFGTETGLNAILDIYRPRIAGQYSRPAYDSRLLGMINEPGGIFHTVASAIDYQFGFRVSQTWFYKLLEKAIMPLVMFSAVTLYLFSCLLVVKPGEQAIIEHFGSFDRIVQPGLTLKLPWPFDKSYMYRTGRIHQVNIGYVDDEQNVNKPLLWGEPHYREEYDLLVASKAEGINEQAGSVPVSLVRTSIPVQYKIKNIKDFLYCNSDAETILETLAYREVVRFAASAKIETEDELNSGNTGESFLGAGRVQAAKLLTERIQRAADLQKLGVEIVFVGLQGVHPPPEVAGDYQQVIAAIQKRQAAILSAEAERNKILSSFVGSVSSANELYELSLKYLQSRAGGDSEQIRIYSDKLDGALELVKGDVFQIFSEAKGYAFERVVIAEATGRRFENQVLAHQASPDIYRRQLRLAMLEETLEKIRKYIVVANRQDMQIYIIDLMEKLSPNLYDMEIMNLAEKK